MAGRQLFVEYNANRLPNCRASYNGLPAWGVAVYVRFQPGGLIFEYGWSGGDLQPNGFFPPLEIKLPLNGDRLELWFRSTDRFGCSEWDSQYGANYVFEISKP